MNNTYKHISDESKYKTFDPSGTQFPPTVTNVQDALAMTSPTSPATKDSYGVVKLATLQEVLDGTDDTKAVTPLGLKNRLQYPDATLSQAGIIQLASNDEALAGTVGNKAIVPTSLKYTLEWFWANRVATESDNGVLKISSQPAAIAGTDNTTAMTPLRVKQAIAEATKLIPSYQTATEDIAGLVQLATAGQIEQGTLRNGFAVSPYGLMRLTGNSTRRGLVQEASLAQANAGTDETVYISARGFRNYNASSETYGTVKLTDVPGTGGNGVALSSNAKVLKIDAPSQTVNGNLNVSGSLTQNGSPVVVESQLDDHMPIGSVLMWVADSLPSNRWAICDGGFETKTNSPVLFQRLGYKYGGDYAENFARPDMRGLFVRGADVGTPILNERGIDNKGKPKLGNDVSGGRVGEIQKQQIRNHKHILPWGEAHDRNSYSAGASVRSNYIGVNAKRDWDNYHIFTNGGEEMEPENIRDSWGTANTIDLIGNENRPWNMSVYYIIKVR